MHFALTKRLTLRAQVIVARELKIHKCQSNEWSCALNPHPATRPLAESEVPAASAQQNASAQHTIVVCLNST